MHYDKEGYDPKNDTPDRQPEPQGESQIIKTNGGADLEVRRNAGQKTLNRHERRKLAQAFQRELKRNGIK